MGIDRWFTSNYYVLDVRSDHVYVYTKHFIVRIFKDNIGEYLEFWIEYSNNYMVSLSCLTYKFKYIKECRVMVDRSKDGIWYTEEIYFTRDPEIILRVIDFISKIMYKTNKRKWNNTVITYLNLLRNYRDRIGEKHAYTS